MAAGVEICPIYRGGLCGFDYNPRKPDVIPSLAVINQKARMKNYPSNLLALKCTARVSGELGMSGGPDNPRQATCSIPGRIR